MAKATIGDKIVEALYSNRVTSEDKRIHTPPLHSRLRCLLFSIGSSNSGTTLYGGDRGGKALFSPFEVREMSESPFRAIVSQLILSPILVPSTRCLSPSIPGHLSEIFLFFLCKLTPHCSQSIYTNIFPWNVKNMNKRPTPGLGEQSKSYAISLKITNLRIK